MSSTETQNKKVAARVEDWEITRKGGHGEWAKCDSGPSVCVELGKVTTAIEVNGEWHRVEVPLPIIDYLRALDKGVIGVNRPEGWGKKT